MSGAYGGARALGERARGVIRRRADADLDVCVAVLAEVHAHSGYPHHWPEEPARWLTPDGLSAAWVAEVGGAVLGHAALCGREISRLYVSPRARGCGLGARLLAAVEAEAAVRGVRLVLEVKTSDASAVALYERRGWVRCGGERQVWRAGGVAEEVEVYRYAAPPPAGREAGT
ncbi:GNAT family N-acetyltransferase [Streptomyces sp. NPDC090442]|uniref:GNAT family N-acetyltransferase n=1 Tax=Streptomyces sp. NPDC090442 TaxID=3365962 RepID=UPI0037FC0A10